MSINPDRKERERLVYLTPTEMSREFGLTRQQVIALCMERGVPIFEGRIELALFRAEHDAREAERA